MSLYLITTHRREYLIIIVPTNDFESFLLNSCSATSVLTPVLLKINNATEKMRPRVKYYKVIFIQKPRKTCSKSALPKREAE